MSTGTSTQGEQLTAALDYAALGWPVLPGAIWHDGHFADPVDESPFAGPCLRPIEDATTDATSVRDWWSTPGLHAPNVFTVTVTVTVTVTGAELGAFAVAESLVMAPADNPWFAAFPTPVLAIPNLPLAYFLVRPPMPEVLPSHEAHVMKAGNHLAPGDALADLIHSVESNRT